MEYDGPNNRLVIGFNQPQREFVRNFLEWLLEDRTKELDDAAYLADELLRTLEIWQAAV